MRKLACSNENLNNWGAMCNSIISFCAQVYLMIWSLIRWCAEHSEINWNTQESAVLDPSSLKAFALFPYKQRSFFSSEHLCLLEDTQNEELAVSMSHTEKVQSNTNKNTLLGMGSLDEFNKTLNICYGCSVSAWNSSRYCM